MTLTQCTVCGTEWQANWTACGHCKTEKSVLEEILRTTVAKRFLFGDVRDDGPAVETPPPIKVSEPPPKPKVKKTPKPAPPKAEPVPVAKAKPAPSSGKTDKIAPKPAQTKPLPRNSSSTGELDKQLERDLIDIDDPILILKPAPLRRFQINAGIYGLDILLCLLLDLLVFFLVTGLSSRGPGALVSYSLIPVFFALLGFTILYFSIFLNLFGMTLGGILWRAWGLPRS